MELMNHQILKERILANEIDIGFTFLFEKEDFQNSGITVSEIFKMPLSVYMHRSNPLSSKNPLKVKDLKDQKFISIIPSYSKAYTNLLTELCNEADFVPNISNYVKSSISMVLNLNDNNTVFLAGPYVTNIDPDIVEAELDSKQKNGFIIAYKENINVPKRKLFTEKALRYWNT